MKQLINHNCKLRINSDGKDLFYTAKIIDVNDTHIYFRDKYRKKFVFLLKDVKEIANIC